MDALICDKEKCERAVEVLKAVAHPIRLRIIALLSKEPTHVQGLSEELQVSQATVSQQLRILRMSGLVSSMRKGAYSYYRLAEPGLKDLLGCIHGCGDDA